MSRYYIKNGDCGVETTFKLVASKHKPMIMYLCYENGGAYFKDLKENIPGITDSILSRALTELAGSDLLRKEFRGGRRPIYNVTDRALDLLPALTRMSDLAANSGFDESDFNSYLEYTRNLIGNKWDTRIIWVICHCEIIRFNELQNSIEDITHKVLTEHLNQLINNDLVARREYAGKVPHVEYSLTKRGRDAYEITELIADWAIKYGLIKPRINIEY